MFGLGGTEILLVLLLAIIFIGPKDLPRIAAQLGKLVRQLKSAATDLRTTIEREVEQSDIVDHPPPRLPTEQAEKTSNIENQTTNNQTPNIKP